MIGMVVPLPVATSRRDPRTHNTPPTPTTTTSPHAEYSVSWHIVWQYTRHNTNTRTSNTHWNTLHTHTLLVGHAALATHALAIELWAGQLNHLPNVQHIYSTATDRLYIYVYIIRYTLFFFLSFCSLSFICFIGMLTAFSAQFTRDRTVTVTVTVHSHRTLIDLDDLI